MITGITVSYNSHALLARAYESVRRHHPEMPIIIVDGSDANNRCRQYVATRKDRLLSTVLCTTNIGHGRGMDLALRRVKTRYALVFDSDIEMLRSPVQAMLDMMEEDTYGVGYIEITGLDGYEYGAQRHHRQQESMRYLHPYFQLIQVAQYNRFHPYVHHGAPCYLAMLDIHKRGLSERIVKEFPGLGHTGGVGWNWKANPALPYIRHDTRGTRDLRLKAHQGEIEPGWVLNRGLV